MKVTIPYSEIQKAENIGELYHLKGLPWIKVTDRSYVKKDGVIIEMEHRKGEVTSRDISGESIG